MTRQLVLQTVQHVGPDGSALWCGKCGTHEYVTPQRATPTDENELPIATCGHCGAKYVWNPRQVLCAAPSHNGPEACSNPKCWKNDLTKADL